MLERAEAVELVPALEHLESKLVFGAHYAIYLPRLVDGVPGRLDGKYVVVCARSR